MPGKFIYSYKGSIYGVLCCLSAGNVLHSFMFLVMPRAEAYPGH